MSLSSQQVASLVGAVAVTVLAAHVMGSIFMRFRQPAVVGEILAGLFFGPTLLALVAPDLQHALFPTTGPVAATLAGLAQLGMLLLMFVTGSELRLDMIRRDRRTIVLVSLSGLILPFAIGLAVVLTMNYRDLVGPAGNRTTTVLVFAIAVAVTSIPVISRIMLDLGLLGGSFARIVLGVAALEDVALYVVLAIVLSIASAKNDDFGLWQLVGVQDIGWTVTYHVAITVLFLTAFLLWGTRVLSFLLYGPLSVVGRRNPTAYRLVLLLIAVVACITLGINAIFGALLSGVCARRADDLQQRRAAATGDGAATTADPAGSWLTIRQFSLAFFIPVYFFTVGLGLDLVHEFDVWFFVWFFVLCCVAKAFSVLLGALLARRPLQWSIDLAIALNARGGPGIVLASTTFAAGVVNQSFATAMVLLSVLTSQIAGTWLDRRAAALRGYDTGRLSIVRAPGKVVTGDRNRG